MLTSHSYELYYVFQSLIQNENTSKSTWGGESVKLPYSSLSQGCVSNLGPSLTYPFVQWHVLQK